ncbi:hypothetical protein EVAR_93394_1 [Eumeta japonica]|uniref:Uncharacterized protein n=1 Tax=Eumeta variegata TaxID=151549 RepID=A0A4C1UQY9_EUMVA|nr:hypothetical protein EVAR_93394_1 [Eumeta japonica]
MITATHGHQQPQGVTNALPAFQKDRPDTTESPTIGDARPWMRSRAKVNIAVPQPKGDNSTLVEIVPAPYKKPVLLWSLDDRELNPAQFVATKDLNPRCVLRGVRKVVSFGD